MLNQASQEKARKKKEEAKKFQLDRLHGLTPSIPVSPARPGHSLNLSSLSDSHGEGPLPRTSGKPVFQ